MKVLVLSDSHGCVFNLYSAIEKESDCQIVFFLGDGISDIEKCMDKYPQKKFICVKGNNDFGYSYDDVAYKYIEGNTIVAAHGHTFSVRQTLCEVFAHAQSVRANVVFYGHTHRADFHYDAGYGIFVLNPGAACSGKYAVATITKDGVDAQLMTL